MNRQRTSEAIAVMRAYADGAKIESSSATNEGLWRDCPEPSWDWSYVNYRIKPEPREFWVYPEKSERYGGMNGLDYRCVDYKPRNAEYIKVREVLE